MNDAIESTGYLGEAIAAGRPEELFRAYETRDARFDGRFFVGVRTTGIFCRPVCPARTPLRRNVDFYSSTAAAFAAGLRPCLRCRPERAPGLRALAGGQALVARALGAIDAGDLNEGSVEALSVRIGVTSRHLRRLFDTYLGATPLQVAQTRRLLFARQLVDESDLTLTAIAYAAGYNSVRRFNTAFRQAYGCAPSAVRTGRHNAMRLPMTDGNLVVRLGTMPASEFRMLLDFYRTRAFRGVEVVDPDRYHRAIGAAGSAGQMAVHHDAQSQALLLTCRLDDMTQLPAMVGRVKRMFDVEAPWAAIRAHLIEDTMLRPALMKPVRVPCAWDPFELAVRAVLGQQVSVKAATTLSGRLVQRFGERITADVAQESPVPTHFFPTAAVLGGARVEDISALGILRSRAETLVALARHVADCPAWRSQLVELDKFVQDLTQLPGIGVWTAQYVAMRGFADPDAFPASDLGLLRSARKLGIGSTPRELERHAARWRPWRAYAAQVLWNLQID